MQFNAIFKKCNLMPLQKLQNTGTITDLTRPISTNQNARNILALGQLRVDLTRHRLVKQTLKLVAKWALN